MAHLDIPQFRDETIISLDFTPIEKTMKNGQCAPSAHKNLNCFWSRDLVDGGVYQSLQAAKEKNVDYFKVLITRLRGLSSSSRSHLFN